MEAEHFISSVSFSDIDSLERIFETLSEAGDTVFTLKQRALNLIADLDMENFYNDMDELSTYIRWSYTFFESYKFWAFFICTFKLAIYFCHS